MLVKGNAAQINEAFFENADYIVNKAESLGLYVLILPLWAKTFLAREPYLFDQTTAYNYGKFIGARYRNKPVLWILGGDRPGRGMEEVTRAMARGLGDGDGGTQMASYHPTGRQSSSMWFQNEPWLDFNSIQSGHSSQNRNCELVASDYQLKPAKPVIDAESGYENITDGLRQAEPGIKGRGAWDVRRYGYLSVEVRLDSMSGKTIRACWYDPRTGASRPAGNFPRTAAREFEPPSSGENSDWVLVLDDAAKKFPVPGK